MALLVWVRGVEVLKLRSASGPEVWGLGPGDACWFAEMGGGDSCIRDPRNLFVYVDRFVRGCWVLVDRTVTGLWRYCTATAVMRVNTCTWLWGVGPFCACVEGYETAVLRF